MDDSAVLRFALVSGLIGFAAFCASYTLHVWRRRNAQVSRREGSLATQLQHGSLLLIIGGLLSVAAGVAIRELERPEGRLLGEGLFSVRVPANDLRLVSVFEGQRVQQGEILAHLESPLAVAQVRELESRVQRLERERETLPLKPLERDPDLVRQQQNATASRHSLRAAMDQLLPAHDGLVRELTLERLIRWEKSAQLEVQANMCQGELDGANIRRDYAAQQLARVQELVRTSSVADSELESWQEQLARAEAEIANRTQRLDRLRVEKTQLTASLQQLAVLAEQQQATLGAELDRVRADWTRVESEQQQGADAWAEDLQRARRFREGQLDQLRLELEECRAALEGAQQTLVIRAPFGGTVVYRDLSPRSADERQPVLVVSRQAGCRMRMRLPAAQAAALERAGVVALELAEPAIEPYFSGRFLQATVLQHRPRYAVAELTCQPPPETVRELVEGERVVSRLLWRPPLVTLVPFQIGVALAVLGAAAWLLMSFWLRRQRILRARFNGDEPRAAVPIDHSQPVRPVAAPDIAARSAAAPLVRIARLESGTVAGLHELLGARLRESLLHRELDEELIAALEWALDRHHVRAVRQLRAGLQCDDELAESLGQMLQESESRCAALGNGNPTAQGDQLERMVRVLKTVAPQLTESPICCC